MEFYLVKDQRVLLSDRVLRVDGSQSQTSVPIQVDLKPVVENSDAKIYCRALANLLIENAMEWKENLTDPSDWTMDPTFRVYLTKSTSGTGNMKIYCPDPDNVQNSVFNRLFKMFGRNLKINVIIRQGDSDNVFEVKELMIIIVYDNPDPDDSEENSWLGCKFYQEDFPNQTWTPWADANTDRLHLSVKLVLNDKALDKLYLENHSKTNLMDDYKTLLEAIPTDFVIVADNGAEVKCHKGVLAERSEVFVAMFGSKMKEDTSNTLELPDMSEAGVRAFLAFIYHWSLEDASKNCDIALELLRAGNKYAIPKLQNAMSVLICSKPMEWYTVDMTVRFFLFARNLDEENGKDKYLKKVIQILRWYANTSADTVLECEEYQELYKKNPGAAMELGLLFLKSTCNDCAKANGE